MSRWLLYLIPLGSLFASLGFTWLAPDRFVEPGNIYLAAGVLWVPPIILMSIARSHRIGYGLALVLIAISSIATLLIFAQIYALGGDSALNVPTASGAVTLDDAIYFAIVTWTTLGYGDLQPLGHYRLIAAIEALYGYFYLGLTVGLMINYLDQEMGGLRKKPERDQRENQHGNDRKN